MCGARPGGRRGGRPARPDDRGGGRRVVAHGLRWRRAAVRRLGGRRVRAEFPRLHLHKRRLKNTGRPPGHLFPVRRRAAPGEILGDPCTPRRDTPERLRPPSADGPVSFVARAQILGTSDPLAVQEHMLKLFDNTAALTFDRAGTKVLGMVSSEKEQFALKQHVNQTQAHDCCGLCNCASQFDCRECRYVKPAWRLDLCLSEINFRL